MDEDTCDDTRVKVRKLNRNENPALGKYASLPPSIRNEINEILKGVRSNWKEDPLDNPNEALIHTGITSIEAAIRQYVQKYAKTAKIKNIVDTFAHKLDEVGCFEKTKRELAKNQEESERIVRQIESIKRKVDDAKAAIKFENKAGDALLQVEEDSNKVVKEITRKYQNRITEQHDCLRGKEISIEDADDVVGQLKKFVKV